MRRYLKRQLSELLDTMQEAVGLLVVAVRENNMQAFGEMLAEQQNAAVTVGNEIEGSEGEGTEAVHLLEEYCEFLWEISQGTSVTEFEKGVAKLPQALGQIRVALQKLPEQRDVVFLPYKASMWDCMESVWEAARADADCYPIVMPVPYFDLKEGQVADRHYEGDKFPKYVPIVDYHNLALEELQPDMIFVHNPFDNCNKVTSVLPQFYSDRLKAVTKRLIYIPYFVTGSAVYVTHRELPSYYNVDFIVTQCETTIESFASSIPRQKFLPLGSPIADRIIKLERQKPSIPEEWKMMLPNGKDFGGNKVVMLNTSISLLLKEKERFLNKIEYIFEMVKNTTGILLVWRPHPLLHATIEAMGSRYAEQFYNLEKRFREEKIGVLDKNPDVGVTVALCDGYIGEIASSLIHMFGIAGKPRFYINMQIPKVSLDDEENEYIADGYCRDEAQEYFLLDQQGWVAKSSIKGGELLPFFKIPDREYIRGRAYCGMELRENKLWLYPDNALGTLVYDMESGMMRKQFDEVKSPSAEPRIVPLAGSTCIKTIQAERFLRGNASREWYEDERYCLEDYFSFLLTAKEGELSGNQGMYPVWLANIDGSCGRKVLQAVKESLSEED